MRNKIFFIIFIVTWAFLVILNFIIKSPEFSEQENRYLASIPKFNFSELVSGKYSEKLDSYINDHFFARNFWLKLNSFISLSTGKTENNGVYVGKDGYLFEKFEYGKEEKDNLEKIAVAINNFSENVDVPIYFLLVPNSIYINQEKLPDYVIVYDQEKIINEFYSKLNYRIKRINTSYVLKQNKDKYLFFKTDHHMTSDGMYLVYKEFCKSAGIKPVEMSEFIREVVTSSFLGTFDSKAQVPNQIPDEIIAYKNDINQEVKGDYDGATYNSIFNEEYLNKKDKYSYFLNGNSAKAVIKTKVNNGKKLLVIKDSYAHIAAQFLCQNYEEVHFVDTRYYKLPISDYIRDNEITDVLFLYNVSNMAGEVSLRGIK